MCSSSPLYVIVTTATLEDGFPGLSPSHRLLAIVTWVTCPPPISLSK